MDLISNLTSPNSKGLSALHLVVEFTAVRIGLKVFTMRTVQSQMLAHRNPKGDLPREKSGALVAEENFAALDAAIDR
jgi:hypothetical protein